MGDEREGLAYDERLKLEREHLEETERQVGRITELEEVMRTGGLLRNDLLGRITELEAVEKAARTLAEKQPDLVDGSWLPLLDALAVLSTSKEKP